MTTLEGKAMSNITIDTDFIAVIIAFAALVISVISAIQETRYEKMSLRPLCDYGLEFTMTSFSLKLKNEGAGDMHITKLRFSDNRSGIEGTPELIRILGSNSDISYKSRFCDDSWIHSVGEFEVFSADYRSHVELLNACSVLRDVVMDVEYRDLYEMKLHDSFSFMGLCDLYRAEHP